MDRAAAQRRPDWFDATTPRREDCVLKALLDDRAARFPTRRVALFEDGTEWTYAGCRALVRRRAAALQHLGVRAGGRVLGWLPNGPDAIATWFAVNYLGAIFVPLNTAYRGASLAHSINAARAPIMIAHPSLLPRLDGLALDSSLRVLAAGDAALEGDESALDDGARPEHWDPQLIIYTSGTTGLSKGVLSPYLQLHTTATVVYGYLRDGEAILVNLPLFHVGGTSAVHAALVRSGSFYLVEGFSTENFWRQVRRGGCATTSGLIGIMGAFLAKAPPTPADRDNPLRCVTMFPIDEQTVRLGERFGFDYASGFNMTELSAPLVCDLNSRVFGGCGRERSGVQCRLVDEHDIEVPRGDPGELIVRSDAPWTFSTGYDGLPAETARAWRNGWFHTGDVFRQDADGNFFFVDRVKDTIRRRGENIASVEVEAAVRAFPGVEEVIAVGVAVESEEEVLVAIVQQAGARIEPRELVEFLVPRLPYYAVPRFVRIVGAIPKTETNKQRKYPFREAGVTADTWDREAAGLRLRRERFESG